MDNKELVLEYDRMVHQFKNQLCVIKTMQSLLNNIESQISVNIDSIHSIVLQIPDKDL